MHTTASLLNDVKTRLEITSDYALAKNWNVTHQRIGHYRNGRATFSDEKAIEIADFLGYDRASVLLSIQAERASRQHQDAIFSTLEEAVRRLGGVAASLCFLAFSLPSPDASASIANTRTASDAVLHRLTGKKGIEGDLSVYSGSISDKKEGFERHPLRHSPCSA